MLRSSIDLLRGHAPLLLFGVGCAFLSSPGQTFFISVFLGSVSAGLGLGPAELGSLYLFATLGAAGLLPLTGHWLDRIDLRRYVALVCAGLAIACTAMGLAEGPFSLFVAFLLLRLTGQGLMTHVSVTSVARHFHEQRGAALSVVGMGLPIAEASLPALAVVSIGLIGWRASYFVVAAMVLFVATPLLVILVRDAPRFTRPPGLRPNQRPPRALDGLRLVVRTRFFWFALPILMFMPFTSTALVFQMHAIGAAKGWTNEIVASGFVAYALLHAAGLLIGGGLVDRLGARRMLALMNLPVILGIVGLALFSGSWVALVFLGLVGLSSGLVQTTVGAVWAEVYGVGQLGTIRSFAVMLMVGGTALGPATVGWMLESGLTVGSVAWCLVAAGLSAAVLAAQGARDAAVRSGARAVHARH